MDEKKAYGTVTALGTDLGKRAKDDATLLASVRATDSVEALRKRVSELFDGGKLAPLAASFNEHIGEGDWQVWRSRLLLQAKMIRDDGKPAPGHESGRGPTPPGGS